MLTNEDIDTILEALDVYKISQEREIYGGIVGLSVLMSPLAADRERLQADMDKKLEAAKVKMRTVKENVVLLEARLIQMKNKNLADAAGAFLKGESDAS
jgi:hypothetical protein